MRFFLVQKILFYVSLLQLENYDVVRFFKNSFLHARTIETPQLQKEIHWTFSLKVIFLISLSLYILFYSIIMFALIEKFSIFVLAFFSLIFLVIISHLFFIPLTLVTLLLKPFDGYRKGSVVKQAQAKLQSMPDLIRIGIVGSYGKTTMKEAISITLSKEKNVLATKGNENTLIGVANLVLNSLRSEHEVLIVEMGEYVSGDIKDLCKLVSPDIGIITGINEAHLERMGNLETTINSIFEIAHYSKETAVLFLNNDDERVKKSFHTHVGDKKINWFGAYCDECKYRVDEEKDLFDEDDISVCYSIKSKNGKEKSLIKTPLLGQYISNTFQAVLSVAQHLGISYNSIVSGLLDLKPVPHRLEGRIENDGSILIDDSYNGNPDGAESALQVLSRYKKRRKIYITPGLVELGVLSDEIHYNLGKKIGLTVDKVFLIKNSTTSHIMRGLNEVGFKKENITLYPSMIDALKIVEVERTSNDIVLIQNDWTQNYK
jgi:UDP-N-acetylmuramoyl-tripeptide--D-alanyl-D-alanine ligase